MENQKPKTLADLVDYLNNKNGELAMIIQNLFGDNDGYFEDFQLLSLDLSLNFKIKLVIAISNKEVQQKLGIEENLEGLEINVEELFEGDIVKPGVQDELDKLKIPDEGMEVILKNFLDNCKLEEIKLQKFEIPEKSAEKKEGEEEIKVKLASDNDFIKICKFMYQMLYSERELHSNPFDNGSDTMTPLREILKKHEVFFKKIFNIENIKDYFKNLDKIKCEDQTFQKLINEFGGAKNISNKIIEFIEQVKKEEKDETKKIEVDPNKAKKKDKINNKGDDVGNKKIKMDWFGIRARIEEICEIVFSVGGLGLTALIALGILSWGALGIGICATLAFIGITRFMATNSWTANHNKYGEKSRFIRFEYNCNKYLQSFRIIIVPVVSFIVGGIFTALGAAGILSLGLGLGLGIPLLGSSFVGIINFIVFRKWSILRKQTKLDQRLTDNNWGLCMGISAIISAIVFSYLGFSGILALPTAIALAAPLCILGVGIGLLTLFAYGVSKCGPKELRDQLKDVYGRISCLGFGYFLDKDVLEQRKRNDSIDLEEEAEKKEDDYEEK